MSLFKIGDKVCFKTEVHKDNHYQIASVFPNYANNETYYRIRLINSIKFAWAIGNSYEPIDEGVLCLLEPKFKGHRLTGVFK